MSYTPTEWKTGDIVSSQRLNKLEEGVKDAYEVMVINDTLGTLDKTWQEIYDAMSQGKMCVVRIALGASGGPISTHTVSDAASSGGEYTVTAGTDTYSASSATEYPKTGGPS